MHAVKCNLADLTTKSINVLCSQQFIAYAHTSEFHMLFVSGILVCTLSVCLQHCEEWQFFTEAVFSPIPSLFPLFLQCDGCLFPFPVWGLMAGLPGFTSHGRSLHLGAGYLLWKLLDVSGTQPPFNNAVVKKQIIYRYHLHYTIFTQSFFIFFWLIRSLQ